MPKVRVRDLGLSQGAFRTKTRALLHKQKGKQRGVREEEKLDNRERIGHAESGHFI